MENQRKKKITNYTILLNKSLGEGACGKVYLGEQDHTKLKVAIKVLQKKTVDKDYYLRSSLFSEIEILKTLKSPNIVGFLDVMESKNSYYIIQQLCDGGELRQLMKKKGKIPEKEAILMLTQICNGFVELIKQGVMHRDLKPQNILIHQSQMKLADFGFSKKDRAKRKVQQTMVGTPLYMSYQILTGVPYSSKCDIWSLGFIFYEMLFGRTPWFGNSQYQLIKNIQTKQVKFPLQISPITKDFIMKCIEIDQNKRFSWDQLLRHAIFNGYFVKKQQKDKQFQNKYKTIMNNIRHQVKQKNIDIESQFKQLGVGSGGSLSKDQFQNLLKTADSSLTKQQIDYIFNKIAATGSVSLSYEQFQKALQKSGIPMSMIRKDPKQIKQEKASDPFGPLGGGLFQHLMNQFTPSKQQPDQKQVLQQQQRISQYNQMNKMNQQMAMIQQQQQQAISSLNMKAFGMNYAGLGTNNLNIGGNFGWGYQQPGMFQQLGFGGSNGLNMINGWK